MRRDQKILCILAAALLALCIAGMRAPVPSWAEEYAVPVESGAEMSAPEVDARDEASDDHAEEAMAEGDASAAAQETDEAPEDGSQDADAQAADDLSAPSTSEEQTDAGTLAADGEEPSCETDELDSGLAAMDEREQEVLELAAAHKGTLTAGAKLAFVPVSGGLVVLGVEGSSKKAGANVAVVTSTASSYQAWVAGEDEAGFITLTNKASGLVLGVASDVGEAGANVCQQQANDSASQRWIAVASSKGGVILYSALGSGLVLEVEGAGTKSGTNVRLAAYSGSKAQSFVPRSAAKMAATGRTLADGYYSLRPAGSSLQAGVTGSSKKVGAGLALATASTSRAQVFYLHLADDGYYHITGLTSQLDLGVGSCLVPGVAATQEKASSSVGQCWNVIEAQGGYKIVSARTCEALGVAAAKGGKKLVTKSTLSCTTWELAAAEPKLSTGVYYLSSKAKSNARLAIPGSSTKKNTQGKLAKAASSDAQRFYVERQKDGSYTIEAICSQRYLTATKGNKVVQGDASVSESQLWRLGYTPTGIQFISVSRKKALAFSTGKVGAKAILASGQDTKTSFRAVGTSAFHAGKFVLRANGARGLCVQADGLSIKSGANVGLASLLGLTAQKWEVKSAGSGTYKIVNILSGKALAVKGGKAKNGANVVQAKSSSSKAQRWKIVYAGQGTWKVLSALGTKYALDAKALERGGNVRLCTASKAENARWVFGKTKIIKIALDPGHGSNDSGAVGNGLRECDLTWDITQACAAKLRSWGYDVYVTVSKTEFKNTSRTTPTIKERVQRAVDNGCTAIFSMHINASGTGTAKGAVILTPNASSYHKEFYQMGIDFAGLVLPRIKTATGIGIWKGFNNIGTWPRDYPTYDPADHPYYPGGGVWDYYGIVRYARLNGMFGLIIEHGFIDNASDASKMRSADSRKKLGEADADAIRAFYQ